MPLIEIVDVVQAGHDPQGPLWGSYIDQPRPGRVYDGGAVDTWGWVLGRTLPAISIEFVHDGRLLRRVPLNVRRPDVSDSFPHVPRAAHGGFRTEIPMVGRRAEFRIDVRCTLSDGTRVPLGVVIARRRWRDSDDHDLAARLVSVIIPCFNQAHYLRDAIESVRGQTRPHVETVVIDDGSVDNTVEVARRFPGVRYIRQDHQGLAAARNTGLRRSNGMYLIFLDADDRLTSHAVESGLAALDAHLEAAFTSGRCRWIASDGSPLPTPEHGCAPGDHYANLLRTNYTGMPATVMYRRAVFEVVLGFDVTPAFRGVEDYELALRIARQFPICCHDHVVAEYRVRSDSMSRNPARMLDSVVRAMQAQRRHVRDSAEHRAAYKAGIRFWRKYYGQPLVHQLAGDAQRREWGNVLKDAWALARRYPQGLASILLPGPQRLAESDR